MSTTNTTTLDSITWVPCADGDGPAYMAWPLNDNDPDGFWTVSDVEGDTLCICKKETAVWLHLLLNKFHDIAEQPAFFNHQYLTRLADEMGPGNFGMNGSWDEFVSTTPNK